MKRIILSDSTLRDGNHAVSHRLNLEQISRYAWAANHAGIDIVEVGHGNGLGASSIQVGESAQSDLEMLRAAKKQLTTSKLGIHVIPGFATIRKDLQKAIEVGVDVVRVASHCTEADITKKHIEFVRTEGREAYGVLMMSHMASVQKLSEEAEKMQEFGAQGVVIMDSAGAYLPSDVVLRVGKLKNILKVPVGFHAHNNLGMAIANSLAAIEMGATILDGTALGFGAGAGNAQLEVLVAVLQKMGVEVRANLLKMLDAAEIAEKELVEKIPFSNSMNIASGLAGVFSGFVSHVAKAANLSQVSAIELFFELGRKKVVAGQEDMVYEIAHQMRERPAK